VNKTVHMKNYFWQYIAPFSATAVPLKPVNKYMSFVSHFLYF